MKRVEDDPANQRWETVLTLVLLAVLLAGLVVGTYGSLLEGR